MRRVVLFIASLCLLAYTSNSAGGADVVRLTDCYQPTEWKLFPIPMNPMSPSFRTELAVPTAAYLRVEVHEDDSGGALVRRLVSPNRRFSPPAVYGIEWWCTCDSLGLPASTLFNRVVVKAYADSLLSQPLFEDSIIVMGEDRKWTPVHAEPGDLDVVILKGFWVTRDGIIEATSVHSSVSDVKLAGGRIGREAWSDEIQVVVSLRDDIAVKPQLSLFNGVQGYHCRPDSTSEAGYRITEAIQPFRKQDATWVLSLNPGELLLLKNAGHYPVVVDASKLIERLRQSGALSR